MLQSLLVVTYSGCDGAMRLAFVIDHTYSCSLEHFLHLLWGGGCGKVHILRSLPREKISYCSSSDPQLKLVLLKQTLKCKSIPLFITASVISCVVRINTCNERKVI